MHGKRGAGSRAEIKEKTKAVTSAAARTANPIDLPETLREEFNRRPFEFAHGLADHPLFQVPRLLELAADTRAHRPGDLYYDHGDVGIGQRWDEVGSRALSVEEAIGQIEHAGAWIIFRRAERAPAYRDVFEQCMSGIEKFIGPGVKKNMKVRDAIIFVSSPRRITSYHIDRECNFLLQIRGEKKISVFDQTDREVLPEKELERFWTVDNNAAVYKPHLQDRAKVFQLLPGNGVHIPVNAPHWLQNGDGISVSLSVNFQFRDSVQGNIYRANFGLRKLGIEPTPPGRSALRDGVKKTAVGAAISTWRLFHRD